MENFNLSIEKFIDNCKGMNIDEIFSYACSMVNELSAKESVLTSEVKKHQEKIEEIKSLYSDIDKVYELAKSIVWFIKTKNENCLIDKNTAPIIKELVNNARHIQ